MAYGTLSVTDLLATTQTTVTGYGEDLVFEVLAADLAAHNAIMNDLLAALAEFTTDRLRRYGGNDTMEMIPVDEFGRANVQKVTTGQNVGFPLDLFQIAIQWTRKWMQTHTPAELTAQYQAAQRADVAGIQKEIKRALFTPTNRLTYTDRFVDKVTLPIRALANATTGDLYPTGPNGEVYADSHTHYLATASLIAADISALILTVQQHETVGEVFLYINSASEAAVRGFTSNFTPYYDSRLTISNQTTQANGTLNTNNAGNRPIGLYDTAEVWVKPWIPANYMAAVRLGGSTPPLVVRTRDGGALGNLNIAGDHEHYPLRAQHMEREFGIAVYGRLSAAALRTNNGTYAAPTL